ncbi:unnamed protein product [Bemisia tabaci]|uniref:Uncharacterized protein n=1 Tax=Bemisia tabaci TaxID=7038 RepID=A0A9P0F6X0_BEMTA|nr:unnamed protein product [Bemisia tabaci]
MNVDDQPERDLIEEYQATTALVRKNNNLIKELIERINGKMTTLKIEKFNNKDFEVVPPFEGKIEQLPRFLRALDYLAAEYEVTIYTNHLVPFLLHVEAKLKGAVAHQIGLGNYQTWPALREKLILAYDDKRDSATLAEELGVMSQKPNETPMQFYERLILHYDQMLAKLLLECNSNKDIVKGVTEHYLEHFNPPAHEVNSRRESYTRKQDIYPSPEEPQEKRKKGKGKNDSTKPMTSKIFYKEKLALEKQKAAEKKAREEERDRRREEYRQRKLQLLEQVVKNNNNNISSPERL